MGCGSCGHDNPEAARFCNACGAVLAARCAGCGADNPPGARFCSGCGDALATRPAEQGEARKVVTLVFADLIGSTSLHERLDAESARAVMDRYYRALQTAIAAHGGTVVKLLGDGVLAAFGVPRVAEDDALRAVRAAIAMQEAVGALIRDQTALVGDIGLRVAINTGEVIVSADHTDVVGDPVNVAARLQQEAHDGDVLIGESTRRLVSELITLAPVGRLSLKGRSAAVTAYRVVSLDRPAGTTATAFVGRDDELRRLVTAYDAAVGARCAHLAVILGSPGLGKSRLLDEFAQRLGDTALVLIAQCDAAGGATFAPLAKALRTHLCLDDGSSSDAQRTAIAAVLPGDDPERIRITAGIGALLAGMPEAPEETFFVVRRLLAALAATRPVLFAIDDLQWAAPLLLDLIEHLVQWSSGAPLLVLAAARPELRETRAALATVGGLVHDVVTLAGLDAGAATRLAANVIGASELPAAVAGRVLAASEGNPLFVGELVRMLVDDGTLKLEADRWTAGVDLAALDMPPTIHALLAARIERLRPEDRLVLERAAVVGRQFSRAAVSHLLPPEAHADFDARLESLRRSELIEPDVGWFLGEPALRFHHVLIRDAAYRRLLKGTRAELHSRFADWIEGRVGATVDHDETIGWHLEQAHQHLRELAPIDAQGRAFGERASRYLAGAGRRALARDDLPLAASLLGRAVDRLDAADPARADLALDWCEALLSAGAVGPAATAIAELGRFASDANRLRAWHTCFAGQLAVLTDPQALRATADAVAAAADALGLSGDAAGEAKAHSVHALALARLGKIGACETALDKALAAARRAGDRRRANAVLAGAPLAALWGPSPVTRASGRCLDVVRVLRITQGAPAVEAVALRCQGVLEALRGRTDAARRMLASSRRMVEELGITQRLLEADVFAGLIELLEGDAAAAERCLRSAYDGLCSHGLGIDAAQAAALLGRALLAQDRAGEAEALSHASEALAGDDLKAAIAWRGVRAAALAQRGEHAEAVALARAAVEIAATTDALLDHADARLTLAVVLRAAGQGSDADAEEARAGELWEAKGASVLAERVRRGAPVDHTADAAALTELGPARTRDRDASTELATAPRIENAATRSRDRFELAWNARDAERTRAIFAPAFRLSDRRALMHLDLDREQFLEFNMRIIWQMSSNRHTFEVLATRGDRLALERVRFEGTDRSIGPSEIEFLGINEVDEHGDRVATVMLDADDLDAAYAELDARYAAGEAATDRRAALTRVFCDAFAGRDWDALAALLAPDLIVNDHRLLGWETLCGPAAYIEALKSLVELAPDAGLRIDHTMQSGSRFLYATTWLGTHEGGRFESPSAIVCELDALGRIHRFDQYELDRLDHLRARFEALGERPDPLCIPANAATLSGDRYQDALAAGDLEAVARLCAPALVFDDRRRASQGSADRDAFIAASRRMVASATRVSRTLLEEVGDRIALERVRPTAPDSGAALAGLIITEVDAEGRFVTVIAFDLDDRRAAAAEMVDRAAGSEAGRWLPAAAFELIRAMNAHDLERCRAALPEDWVFHDHRRTGLGRIDGPDDYLASLAALFDSAPDLLFVNLYVVAREPHGQVAMSGMVGRLADGGDFESFNARLALFRGGRLVAIELFEPEDLDLALARLEAQRPSPAQLHIPPNAATRAMQRWQQCVEREDWDALRALFAPELVYDDRRRLFRVSGDRDKAVANIQIVARSGADVSRTLLATMGDRLALERTRFVNRPDAPAFEIEILQIIEVDAEGRIIAAIAFDQDDRRAASAELFERSVRSDAAGHQPTAGIEFIRALRARDLHRMRAQLPDGFVFHDHRRTGAGRLDKADEYIAFLAALFEQAPDVIVESLYTVAVEAHGVLDVGHLLGSRDGGNFESVFARILLHHGDRIVGAELFELEDLDSARARFAELRPSPTHPDPLRIPPNAATRAAERWGECAEARSWDRFAELIAPSFVYEDRRPLVRHSGDRDRLLASVRLVVEAGGRVSGTTLATAGDRLALQRVLFSVWEGTALIAETEILQILEVDAEGRVVATISYDVAERRAASTEMLERYARSDDARWIPTAAFDLIRAMNDHDLDRCRTALHDPFVFDDHRRTGVGRIERADDYVASLAPMFERAPDVTFETLYSIATNEHGNLAMGHMFGTLADGGAVESFYVRLTLFQSDRLVGTELFEPEDLDLARARFAALTAAQ